MGKYLRLSCLWRKSTQIFPNALDHFESMRKLRLYDIIFTLLNDYPPLRDSDKKLIWNVWGRLGFLSGETPQQYISRYNFMEAPSVETIRRTRQKIQETHKALRSSQTVQETKNEIARQKGTFIYREPIQIGFAV